MAFILLISRALLVKVVRQPFLGAKLLQIFKIRKFMIQKTYNIVYKGRKLGNFELLKSAQLNTGYTVCLFRGEPYCHISNYIVTVKRGDETIEFQRMSQMKHPFSMYLDFICCYA